MMPRSPEVVLGRHINRSHLLDSRCSKSFSGVYTPLRPALEGLFGLSERSGHSMPPVIASVYRDKHTERSDASAHE